MNFTVILALKCASRFTVCPKRNIFTFGSRNKSVIDRRHFLTSQPICLSNSRYITESNKKYDENSDPIALILIRLKYLRLIKAAIREKGPILEENPKLAAAVESAKFYNVPIDILDYARNIYLDTRVNVGLQELILPSGMHFIVQYEDIDPSSTRHNLLQICNRSDGTTFYGNVKWHMNFNQKGIVALNCQVIEEENLQDTVTRCGAETAKKEADEEGIEQWKFYCNATDLHKVKKCLQEISPVEEAYISYIPKNIIVPSANHKNIASDVFSELSKIRQIDRIFTNLG